jgi:hypothetical protein
MGNVVLEAMACGCPVVVPEAGGIPSLVSHRTTGFLYRPRDVKEAVHHTRTVLDNEDLRSRVGQAARQAIEDRNWEQSVGRVRQVYADAIKECRPAPAAWNWKQRLAQATVGGLVSLFRSLSRKEKAAPRQPKLSELPPAFLAAAGVAAS